MEIVIDAYSDYDNIKSKVGSQLVFEQLLRMSFKERNKLGVNCRDYCGHTWALVSSHRSSQ